MLNLLQSNVPTVAVLTLTLLGILRKTCCAAILPLLELVGRQKPTHHFLHELVTVAEDSTANCHTVTSDRVTDVIKRRRLPAMCSEKTMYCFTGLR